MLLDFEESSAITFSIRVDTETNHHTQNYDVVLGLDAIIELGIAIDSKNKTIIWEDVPILTKHV